MEQKHYTCPCLEYCPLNNAMAIIGGKWKMQILCSLNNSGAIRYNQLRKKMDGVSNTILSNALKDLEKSGLIIRTEYLEVPVRVEYETTPLCHNLIPILEQLGDWYEKNESVINRA